MVVLKSMAAKMCRELPGYQAKLEENIEAIQQAFTKNVEDVFTALFAPLAELQPPPGSQQRPCVILVDALDELPNDEKGRMLNLFTSHFIHLPSWIRLFVTSREENLIKRVFEHNFEPFELRVDAEKNLQDLRAYLRKIAKPMFNSFDARDLQMEIRKVYGVEFRDADLVELQENMEAGVARHGEALRSIKEKDLAGYKRVLEITDRRPELRQEFRTLEEGFAWAKEGRDALMQAVAADWVEYTRVGETVLSKPVGGFQPGLDASTMEVIEPGLKSEESAQRKLTDEYDGEVRKLKDLTRMSFVFKDCAAMLETMQYFQNLPGWKMLLCKNKYASPTPLGYSDVNTIFSVPISQGRRVLCELQFHMKDMILAKDETHVYYENIRVLLPRMCAGHDGVNKDELQGFIKKRLDTSVLDAAVEKMEANAKGLFIYARMLADHMKEQANKTGTFSFEDVLALPTGLTEVYQENFLRVFPEGKQDRLWKRCKELIALIGAAKAPLPVEFAQVVLGWSDTERVELTSKLSLVFPERDGRLHVLHKTVMDWLKKPERRHEDFYVSFSETQEASKKLAHHALLLVEQDTAHESKYLQYPLQFALAHVRDVASDSGLLERAALALLRFPYLLRRAAVSSPKLLEDATAISAEYRARKPKSDEYGHAVSLLRSALSLSMQGLLTNYKQLAGQLIARLMMYEQGEHKVRLITEFLREVRQWSGPEDGRGWWCPMTSTYTPAGGALQATLTGHSDHVNCVKYRPKSERSMFVTASDDKTLKVSSVRFVCVYVRVRA